jgi:hypothetical protein
MLHRLKYHDCDSNFQAILRFQRTVLEFIWDANTILPLTETALQNKFGNDIGKWVWAKCWKYGNPSSNPHPFYEKLCDLIEFARSHPGCGQQVLDAFDNDTSFHDKADNPTFSFQFLNLDNVTNSNGLQRKLSLLLGLFYTDLFHGKFPGALIGEQDFGRADFASAFWSKNNSLRICPACDTLRPEEGKDKIYADIDHFFPKSTYPFLSVHPFNLAPICSVCNTVYKKQKDPIDNHQSQPLVNLFQPYVKAAIDEIDVQVNRISEVTFTVELYDLQGMPSRRLSNLERLFCLEERWQRRLPHEVVKRITERVIEWGGMLRHRHIILNEGDLEDELRSLLEKCTSKIGEEQDQILWKYYIVCVLQDNDEFATLFEKFSGE